MAAISLNAIFIVGSKGFFCSNDGFINVAVDISPSNGAIERSSKRIKRLTAKNVFMHNGPIEKDEEVICLTRMSTGNIFHYNGVMTSIDDKGKVIITLTSPSENVLTKEIIKTIVDL